MMEIYSTDPCGLNSVSHRRDEFYASETERVFTFVEVEFLILFWLLTSWFGFKYLFWVEML